MSGNGRGEREFRELLANSSIGQAVEEFERLGRLCRGAGGLAHVPSGAALRAAAEDLIDTTRCIACHQRIHLVRGRNPGGWEWEFWIGEPDESA